MENKRQTLVKIIFLVFFFIIFEGAFRKWLFPGQHSILFFIRDPFVILAYIYALGSGLIPKPGLLFYTCMGFTGIISLFCFFQTMYSHLPWWIIAYSWRTHFLMLPLMLLIAEYVKIADIKKLLLYTTRLLPMYTVLVYYQSTLPQWHWVNAGRLGLFRPLLAASGLVRTEGLFTSSIGNAIFAATVVAFLLAAWTSDDWADAISHKEKLIYTFFITAIVAMSGQRTTFILVGLVIASAYLAALSASKAMLLRLIKPTALILLIGSTLLFTVFTQHRLSIAARFAAGSSTVSDVTGLDIVLRTLNDFADFTKFVYGKIPEMGLGIGYSSNAAHVYNISVMDIYSEGEWGRHIIELGPYFGFLTIIFRVSLFVFLLIFSIYESLKKKNAVPFIFFSVISSFLLTGQLTGNGIASGFIWFLTGVTLSLLKNSNDSQSLERAL